MMLVFIVNGEPTNVEVDPNSPLEAARDKALIKSRNTGRSPDGWEIRDMSGTLIADLSQPIESYAVITSSLSSPRLFLSLKVAAGGI